MTEEAYNPISCSLHDELLSLATLRRVVPVVWKGADGTEHQTDEKIVDVFSRKLKNSCNYRQAEKFGWTSWCGLTGRSLAGYAKTARG
ncbi:MAG: hypothetical protein UZ07_CHB004002449 [Chlorobi bacterium OLB7]|nr:MAG: hypothetical protein UZ07_CHB004002449 [Chlorobi bacterium OLB7]